MTYTTAFSVNIKGTQPLLLRSLTTGIHKHSFSKNNVLRKLDATLKRCKEFLFEKDFFIMVYECGSEAVRGLQSSNHLLSTHS